MKSRHAVEVYSNLVKIVPSWQVTAGLIFLLTGVLLHGPALLGCVLGNCGMLSFRDALLTESARPGTRLQLGVYPLCNVLPASQVAPQVATFQRAAVLGDDNPTTQWGLLRTALATGDALTAAQAAERLDNQAGHNLFLYQDALSAFICSGKPEKATSLYERVPPPQRMRSISDTIALAYLEMGGQGSLGKVKELRPGDLYANYHLWKAAGQTDDQIGATADSGVLIHFPLEAISPANERLLDYAAMVIPGLLADGLWDHDRAVNAISCLVWQHSHAPGVERLLKDLVARYPTEPDWLFYLAELYYRRGDWERARETWQQMLIVDPERASVYLRLGMIAEAESQGPNPRAGERAQEAARWYEQYHEMVPDDLLGLQKLARVYTALGKPEAVALQRKLVMETDDRLVVAKLMNLPVDSVELGPNLVESGDFEIWRKDGRPRAWIASDMFNYAPFGEALFVSGAEDELAWSGHFGVRITGVWQTRQPGQSRPRAGFWAWNDALESRLEIPVQGGKWYEISLMYQSPDANLALWVAEDPALLFSADRFFPATDGSIRRYVGVFQCRASGTIRPLIRYWGENSAWFDDLAIRSIVIDGDK